jgi:hypothetical protein
MCPCRKEINTLTIEEIIIVELIYQIEDPENIYMCVCVCVCVCSKKDKIITNSINYNFTNVSNRFKKEKHPISVQDLQFEINSIKQEIKELKPDFKISNEQLVHEIITLKTEKQQTNKILQNDNKVKIEEIQENNETKQNSTDNNLFINLIDRIIFQKWYVEVTLIINAEFQITTVALLDLDANMNCIKE